MKIGTYFALNGAGIVAAKITTLPTPPSTCSKYILEFQATKLNLSAVMHNPISLDIDNANDDVGCINIDNALIGVPF